ncbi:MAG: hypothetical protein ACKO13_11535, partial [Cytophagales bacterium]
ELGEMIFNQQLPTIMVGVHALCNPTQITTGGTTLILGIITTITTGIIVAGITAAGILVGAVPLTVEVEVSAEVAEVAVEVEVVAEEEDVIEF